MAASTANATAPVNESIKQALAQLEPVLKAAGERPPRSFRVFARILRVEYEEWEEYVYEAVYRRIREKIPRRSSGIFAGVGFDPEDIIVPSALEPMPTVARGPTVRERIGMLELELRALEVERSNLDGQLTRIAKPSGIGRGVAILAYFATVGIAFPVSLMPVDRLDSWVRLAVIGSFVSGLALVIGYVIWLARTLSPPTGSRSRDSA